MKSSFCIVVALVTLFAVDRVEATCHGTPGHVSRLSSAWPYTEDIANPSATPYGDVTVSYNSWQWTTIQSGCVDVGQKNLFASASFNALLRAQPTIVESTVPIGTHWESELVLIKPDLTEVVVAWDTRHMRGDGTLYRQIDRFGGTVAALPAGDYTYQHRVRIIDNVAGHIKFESQWITGQGVPSTYPSGGTVYNGQQTVSSAWIPIGTALTIPASSTALDLSIVGSGHILSGTLGSPLQIGFSIDGQSSGSQYGLIAVPAALPDGFTAFDYKINLSANAQHTLQMWMQAPSGNITIELPGVAYVSYPNALPENLGADEAEIRTMYSGIATDTVYVDSATTAQQPDPRALSPICGKWTKLLEFDIPGHQQVDRTNTALNVVGTAYVQFAGGITGNPNGEVAAELIQVNDDGSAYAAAEMGVSGIWATNGNDGLYVSFDGIWANFANHNHVTLWMRQISSGCLGSPLQDGGWYVSKRYLSIKFLPAPGSTVP